MKLIIQIPCYNEADTLADTLADLPTRVEGVDEIEVLVVDDGSTDGTVAAAEAWGVEHIVRHPTNLGLAAAFQSGLDACLQLGADIIVNTDGDNQYPGSAIPALVAPILAGRADMVIGDRQTDQIDHFSRTKRLLQRLGSAVVRYVSGTDVPDAPSGFRALTWEAALRLNVVTGYTYTLETIIQAGKKNLTVTHVPVQVNPQQRESRLIKSTLNYVLRSAVTILQLFLLYEPLRTFTYISIPFLVGGLIPWVRFLILMLAGQTARGSNIQSITVGAVLIITGTLIFAIGLIGNLLAINRQLHEETLYRTKKMQFNKQDEFTEALQPGRERLR